MNTQLLLEMYQTDSPKKLEDLSKKLPINLSLSEIQQIKLLCKQANPLWLLTGVPSSIRLELINLLGKKRTSELLKLLFSTSI